MKASFTKRAWETRRCSTHVCVLVAFSICAAWTTAAMGTKPPPAKRQAKERGPVQRLPSGATKIGVTNVQGKPVKMPAPGEPRPTIKAEDPVKDFGTLWVGPVLEHSFTLKNEGDATLTITKVKPSCGCTIAGKYPTKLEPGESGKFPFKLASTKLRGRFEKAITVSSNDPATPSLRLKLRGEVKRYVELTPANVNFGKLLAEEPVTKTIKITNNTESPLELSMGQPLGGNFKTELTEKTPGKAFELRVTASPPFETGTVRKNLTLTTNVAAQRTLTVNVRGSVPERLEVTPSVLTLGRSGRQPADKPLKRVVRFTNYGKSDVKLLEANAADPAISVSVNEQRSGKSYNIQVSFPAGYTPPAGDTKITLKTDDAEKPSIEIPVRSPAPRPKTATAKRPARDMVGQVAPAFALTTTEGKPFGSQDLKNKVTVIDFFATNCGFCKKQIPRLETIRKQYADKGVRFVAVSQTMRGKKSTDEQVIDKVKELGFRGELATDPNNTLGPLFKATSYPTMAIIGKTGKIDAVNLGNLADLETRLRGQLNALLAGKPVPTFEKVAARRPPKERPKRKRPDELVGKPAPAFATKTLDDKPVSSVQFKDHPATVLNFIAANCGYCKKQIPRTEKIRQKYAEKGVRFVNVVETMRTKFSTEDIVAKMKELGSNLEIAHDVDNKVGPLFNATGYPTMIVVGKSGKVEAVNVGNIADLEKRLTAQLDAMIEGKPVPKFAKAERPKRKRPGELVGKPAPAFATKTLDDKPVSSAQFKDHPATVLNFVAANCGYCKKQIPRTEKLRQTYAEKGVRFVNVVETMRTKFSTEDIVAKMKELGSNLEVAHDVDNKVGPLFNATGYPTMIVIGKSGKVEAANVGNIADLEKRLAAQLDALIEGKPVPKFASAQPKQQPRQRPAMDLVGKPAPNFALKTLGDKGLSSADFKDHPATVLNFVAPNCGFCKRQLPTVEKVRQEYEAKGIRFINVAQKMRKDFTNDEIVDTFKKAGANLELTTTDFGDNKVGGLFKVVSFPTMFVVGKDGTIANVNIGAKQDLETLLKGQLDTLIKGKSTGAAPTKDEGKAVATGKP